ESAGWTPIVSCGLVPPFAWAANVVAIVGRARYDQLPPAPLYTVVRGASVPSPNGCERMVTGVPVVPPKTVPETLTYWPGITRKAACAMLIVAGVEKVMSPSTVVPTLFAATRR